MGLPVLTVLSWVIAGLVHQPSERAPLVRHVAEDPGPLRSPSEDSPRPSAGAPRSPVSSPDARAADHIAGPRWTPAATSRPLPSVRPLPVSTPAPSGGRAEPRKEVLGEVLGRPSAAAEGSGSPAPTARPSVSASPTGPLSVAARPSAPAGAARAGVAPEPSHSPAQAAPAGPPPPAAAPSAERRAPAPEQSQEPPVAPKECRGLLMPLLGCPSWVPLLGGL